MKRLLFTFKLLAILLIVDACLKCEEVTKPYFDFKSLSVSGLEESVAEGEEFSFIVYMEDVYYIASAGHSFNLISTVLAREECNSDGYMGYKYGLDSVRVESSGDWDSIHPVGSSLNDIVYIRQWWSYEEEYKLLAESGLVLQQGRGVEFVIKDAPVEDLKHVFRLTYYKSTGEAVEGSTDTITWVP